MGAGLPAIHDAFADHRHPAVMHRAGRTLQCDASTGRAARSQETVAHAFRLTDTP